ncbi:MAG: hypothetical protein IPL62_07780 [Caulobacteraceae bacterium]|nr:hypothetical protein [Caulobacteraceae bacterium]
MRRFGRCRPPLFEHRAEIEIDGVVLADGALFGIIGEDAERVGAGADEPLVPVAGDAELAVCQGGDVRIDFAFASAGLNKARVFDGGEHLQSPRLRFNQARPPFCL